MTSSTQLIGQGSGSSAVAGLAAPFGRRRDDAEQVEQPESLGRGGPPPLPGRDTAPSPANVVRLPGQEGTGDGGPRRPLITGGAFTLAVAIGLSLDQTTQPDRLEPATPSTTGGAPEDTGEADSAAPGASGLTEEEQEVVEELRARDAEVRRHEAAHAAAGGQYAGSPTFTYQTGPDGRQYAVGGEVSIDSGPVKGDPEATIRKAQQIKAAASAPADPSSQDRRVAAQADALRQQAQAELSAERQEERALQEAEAAEAEAKRAEQQAATGGTVPSEGVGVGVTAAGTAAASDAADSGPGDGRQDGRAAPDRGAGAIGFTGAEGDEDDDAPAFAPAAFSAAAASYRGPGAASRLVSIAV